MMRLTPLFLLVLAAVPVVADDSTVTVGDVKFECKVSGSDKDGFDIIATNTGQADKKCKASCTLTKNDGKPANPTRPSRR